MAWMPADIERPHRGNSGRSTRATRPMVACRSGRGVRGRRMWRRGRRTMCDVAAEHGSTIGSRVEIGYEQRGDPAGWPVVLVHGFPYDPRCFDGVADLIVGDGARVIVPYLRGYGPSR